MLNMTAKREELGLSKAELARRASIDQASVSKIEKGMLIPYEKQKQRIADALQIKPEELLIEVPDKEEQKEG